MAATSVAKYAEGYLDEGVTVERKIGRETLRIMTGVLAKQADGAVLVTYRDSAVLVTATTAKPFREASFFPLTVDYRERTPAAGKFPGGFIKREGRPSTKEILTCRCIDRPIRPLFPDGFMDEVQVLCNVFSADPEYDPDVLAMIGAFASLHLSRIPFRGAGGSVRVGRKDGNLILIPTHAERDEGDLDLVVAGHDGGVAMVEAGANELSEATMIEAIEFGHRAILQICEMVEELREKAGVPKMEFEAPSRNEELFQDLKKELWDDIRAAILTEGKHAKKEALGSLRDRMVERRTEGMAEDDPELGSLTRELKSLYGDVVSERTRAMVLEEEVRADGRGLKDIRPIRVSLGLLPRVHGSAVFTRGETQALASMTLGTQQDEQKVDGLRDPVSQRFYLHYSFPPFSVGECKPIRGPGRREIGHGALAERALVPVLPEAEEFPYTIRITSDILESNGSSSMATVCGGTLAMLHGGVPLKSPVAGIAMGLISDGNNHKVLSDILGLEDHDGDMDFKVTGTANGVTALQMDIKITGLSSDVMEQALEQAREGRLHILDVMSEVIPKPHHDLHPHAPRILRTTIPVAKIALLIGPGGKNIRMIQERSKTNLEVNDDGVVLISGHSEAGLQAAAQYIDSFTREMQVGDKFEKARVVEIKDFGAFIELTPGQEALCHVSELSDDYVENVADVVSVDDELSVTVIAVDPSGKVKVSAKSNPNTSGDRGGDRGRPRRGGGDRGGPPRSSSGRGGSRPPRGDSRPRGGRDGGGRDSGRGGDREGSRRGERRRRRD